MYKKLKKITSFILLLCFLTINIVPIYAQTSDVSCSNEAILNLKFIKISDNQLIYTFEKENIEYKYIDYIINSDTVITEKYIKENKEKETDKFVLYETITTDNLSTLFNEKQNNDFPKYYFDNDEQLLTNQMPVQTSGYQFYWSLVSCIIRLY